MSLPDWTPEQVNTILGAFDTKTLGRAEAYASSGMVSDIDWTPPRLSGTSQGSRANRYRCTVVVDDTGSRTSVSTTCTCPVGRHCKHCAALVLSVGSLPRHPSSSGHESVWRDLMAEIAGAAPSSPAGPELELALEFSLTPRSTEPGFRIRPLVRSETGRLVSGRLTVKSLRSGRIDGRYPARALNALVRLVGVVTAASPTASSDAYLPLRYAPPTLWSLLDDAWDAGVDFVFAGRGATHIAYRSEFGTALHVRSGSSGVHVDVDLTIDGQLAPTPTDGTRMPIGTTPIHGYAQIVDATLHIGPVRTLTTVESRILADGRPLFVGPDDFTDFRAALADLPADRPVTVDPDAFPATEVTGPYPVLRIDTGTSPSATWLIGYDVDGEHVELGPEPAGGRYRHAATESTMWQTVTPELQMVAEVSRSWVADAADRLRRALPRLRTDFREYNRQYAVLRQLDGGASVADAFTSLPLERCLGRVSLTPLEAAVLWSEKVPEIEALGRVRVHLDGDEPAGRVTGPVGLRFSGDTSTDWFDLAITVDVDDHHIPLPTVIAALAAGEEFMLLDDGSYFPLDIPELVTLRERLAEAREMGEIDDDRVSTHTLNATLWDELLDLGVVDDQLAGWRNRMAALAAAAPPHAVTPSPRMLADLRPYQQDGLDWLTFLWDNGLGGILADDMGLGKTVQTLALIRRTVDADPNARFLVVAPTSVISNWVAESRRFTPDLGVVAVTATAKRAGSLLSERTADAQIVVTSYSLLRIDYDAFATVDWAGAVFDEAQFLKNHNSKTHLAAGRLDAAFKLAITGTPMENRVMELWSLVSVVAPGLYPSPLRFKDHFARPIESGQAPERLELLRRRLRPIMLRRTKDQVLTDLPDKQEQVLRLELTSPHRTVYDTHLARHRQETLGLLDDFDGNRIQILRALTRLRQLSLHPALVDDAHSGMKSAKIEYLAETLPVLLDEGHSALVFSSFTGFLDLIAQHLDASGVPYSRIDGSTPATRRATEIEQFTGGTTGVFLISLKAGGFGLNLTAADYCFLADPWWNPAAEAQAVDRAHRIGQHRAVTVYRMVSEGTIEDKVIELQDRKRALFDALIDDGAAFSGAVTADDVRSLIE